MIEKIRECKTRSEGKELLKGLKKKQLIELAKEINFKLSNSLKKDEMVDRIIDVLIGFKLDQQVMASIELKAKW